MIEPVILIHGGAWAVPTPWVENTVLGVKEAAKIGYNVLKTNGSALDAVEAAVKYLEDNENFNCGRGSCLNIAGQVSLESSIQRGSDLAAGCVTLVNDIRHPVSLAREILENSPHTFIGGSGARQFAIKQGVDLMKPSKFITEAAKLELKHVLELEFQKYESGKSDTVGAVVIDSNGHVAAATSTGGTPGKYIGRIGDAPQIGSGTYADDFVGAVSSTGHGETISKFCLAHTIIKHMEGGMSAQQAATKSVNDMTLRLKNTGGAIAVSNKGDVGFHFTTPRMSWCYIKGEEVHYGIEPEQHEICALSDI